jgi:hypothetical protein
MERQCDSAGAGILVSGGLVSVASAGVVAPRAIEAMGAFNTPRERVTAVAEDNGYCLKVQLIKLTPVLIKRRFLMRGTSLHSPHLFGQAA